MDIRNWLKKAQTSTSQQDEMTPPADDSSEPRPTTSLSPHDTHSNTGDKSQQVPRPMAPTPPSDLGDEEPLQVMCLYPSRSFSGSGNSRSFSSSWFKNRDWLEYSVERDAAFCYACRKFGSAGTDDAFTTTGYNNWRHALVQNKGLKRHESSKEHMSAVMLWKERLSRVQKGTEISSLVNSHQLERNRAYLSAIVDIIEFIAVNQLPFRGSVDAVDARGEEGCGIFLALMDFTLKKDKELAKIFSTIPSNATYTSNNIQN